MTFDLFPKEQYTTEMRAARNPSITPDPGTFTGFFSGAGSYTMRSLAESGRAISMAASPLIINAPDETGTITPEDREGIADAYYGKVHEPVFQHAVEYWTPSPSDVGAAGQIAGQLAGGVLQAIVSPALLVGTTQMSTAEELARKGVDATTANVVGAVQGAGMAVGLKLPFIGETLAKRVISGAGGNLLQGGATAAASAKALESAGYTKQASEYNPWDLRARLLDVMLGVAFGGLAHIEAKADAQPGTKTKPKDTPKPVNLTPTEEAAILVANQARHIEESTPLGRPATDADATMHAAAMKEAINQVSRGEKVAVDHLTKDINLVHDDALLKQRAEVTAEFQRAIDEIPYGPRIEQRVPNPPTMDMPVPVDLPTASTKALRALQEHPELNLTTGAIGVDGQPVVMRAADAMLHMEAELTYARNVSKDLFKAAAHCLTGAI